MATMTIPAGARRYAAWAWLPALALLAGFGWLVARNAWLSDDAYITFRTVDNFVHGYGLTWNVTERVQVYTHPLWMFLLSGTYAVTGEITITSQVLSIVISLLAVGGLLFGLIRAPGLAALAVAVFGLSKAFVDYATSGLENPLTHLLLAGALLTYVRRRHTPRSIFWLSLWAALGMTNRTDLALIFGPALAWAFLERPSRQALGQACLGFLPLAAWELFSLAYYGALVPNTALAKLNTGLIRQDELVMAGLQYLYNSLRVDPVTLITIAIATLLPLALRTWDRLPLSLGMAVYLIYIVRIGGDFMSGRFLSAPLFVAVGLLTTLPWSGRRWRIAALGSILIAVGITAPYTPLRASGGIRADEDAGIWVAGRGIKDERANYHPGTGLLPALQATEAFPIHDWAVLGRRARTRGPHTVVKGSVGFYGYYAGPEVTVVDLLALGDPLLARLPVMDPEWKIGHYGRFLPAGYLQTLESGHNVIADPNLARFYDSLAVVTRGPLIWRDLWDLDRWREIWRLNAGTYQPLISAYVYRNDGTFVRNLRISNPTEHPYVYAYLWNVGPGDVYLLDDTSGLGDVYDVRWTITGTGATFEGEHLARISALESIADSELLSLGVFFADDGSLTDYEMFERRYWFREDAEGPLTVVMPGPLWYNGAAPGGFWEQTDAGQVMTLTP